VANKSQIFFVGASCALHIALGVLLFANFETTIKIQPIATIAPKTPIIDAVAITEADLDKEVARLDALEDEKKAKEQARQQVLKQKQVALERKRKQEQARVAKLKRERALLKKEEQVRDRAHKEKLAKEKATLAKIQKEKEDLLQEKQRIEQETKQAELAEQKRKVAEQKEAEKKRIAKAEAEAKVKAEQERLAKKKIEAEEKEKQRQLALETQRIVNQQIQHFSVIIKHKINQNWRQPLGLDLQGFKCKLSVRLSKNGDVLSATVVSSSGNLEFDRSSELAVRKSSPLPLPEQKGARAEFMKFTFTFYPGGMA